MGQTRCVEIHDQPDAKITHAQAGVELRLVGRQDGSNWFHYHNHIARDAYVCPDALANWLALWVTGMATYRSNGMSASRNSCHGHC